MKFYMNAPKIIAHEKMLPSVLMLKSSAMMLFRKLSSLSLANKFHVNSRITTSTTKASTVLLLLRCILKEREKNAKYKVKSTLNPFGTIIARFLQAVQIHVTCHLQCCALFDQSNRYCIQCNANQFFCRQLLLITQ